MLGNQRQIQRDSNEDEEDKDEDEDEDECVTYSCSLRVSDIEDLFLSRHLQDVVYNSWKILQSHFIITTDRQTGRQTDTVRVKCNFQLIFSSRGCNSVFFLPFSCTL